jgi:hypothetical protein
MKKLINLVLFSIVLISVPFLSGQSMTEKEYANYQKEGEARTVLELQGQLAAISPYDVDAKTIEQLGTLIHRIGSLESYRYQKKEVEAIMNDARDLMFRIPNYADYFAEKINNARQKFDDRPDGAGNDSGSINALNDLQNKTFKILQQLPGPQTVRVLGDFLSDNRGRIPKREAAYDPESMVTERTLSDAAANTLSAIIANGPTPPEKSYLAFRNLQSWVQWYERLKGGKQTYRFIGNAQEYDLTGPVREARSSDVARVTKRPGVSSQASAAHERESSKHSATPWVAGILTMMAGIGVYVYLQKKRCS